MLFPTVVLLQYCMCAISNVKFINNHKCMHVQKQIICITEATKLSTADIDKNCCRTSQAVVTMVFLWCF